MGWDDAPPTTAELAKTTPSWDAAPPSKQEMASLDDAVHMQKIKQMDESGYASGNALFDTLTAGHLPQIKAKLGQLLSGEGIANDENYVSRRDKAIADMKALADKYPGPTREGKIVGIIAPMLASGGMSGAAESAAESVPLLAGEAGPAIAKASLPKVIAKGAGIGAMMGAAQNPGDTPGVVDPIQGEARAKNAAIGAAIGGTLSGAASKIPDAAEALNNLAETKAFKAAGAMLKDFRKAAATGQVQDTGRFILDNGLLKAGDTVADVAEKASALKDSVGEQLGKGYDAASQILPKLGPEAVERVSAAGFNPVRDKAEILKAAKEELGYSFRAKGALSQISDYLDELAEKHGDKTLNVRDTNSIKTALDKTAINWERNPLTRDPDAETALKTFRGYLGNKVSNQVQTIGEAIGNPEAAKNLADLNSKYGMASKVARIANDRVNRDAANQMLSLTDKIAASGAAAAKGGAPGLAAAAAAGIGSKVARTFGNGVIATGANAGAQALERVASIPGQIAANPGVYKELAGNAPPLSSINVSPKTAELDRDSSTTAQTKVTTTKGPDKWATQGFDKLTEHLGDSADLNRTALMSDPKTKQLLIQASDLKPGSKAMDNLVKKLKEPSGKDTPVISPKTSQRNSHPADSAMISWAKQNQNAPGAREVLQANGH